MNSWIDDIRAALITLGGVAHRQQLIEEVRRIRPGPHSDAFAQIIQSTIQAHSSDSTQFRGRGAEYDLLYSVEGVGAGVWGLRAMLQPTPTASDIGDPEAADRALVSTYRILRDTELARKIKRLHQNRCQLCDLQITLSDGETYAEGHHIKPLGRPHDGPDAAANIIVVCPNHHVELDYGAIDLNLQKVRQIHGHRIGEEFVEYHNQVIRGGRATQAGHP